MDKKYYCHIDDQQLAPKSAVTYNCIAVRNLRVFQITRARLHSFWMQHRLSHALFVESKITPITAYLKQINVFKSLTLDSALMLASMFRWRQINQNDNFVCSR